MKEKIGLRIRDARLDKGISQETLAELAETSLSCISRLETGKTMVSVEKLLQIADALNVGVDNLLQDYIYNGTVEGQLMNRIGLLLGLCTKEEQKFWVENLQMYVDIVKKNK